MSISKDNGNKQNRITVNFRVTSEEEQKLYRWIKENGVINGDSAFIKSILYKEFIREQEEGK
ncbi:hypothetical protein [Caproiciproducens sp. MSJ-32]|uniref:hypothetical protein n=1 Tax=Caproiciproducens sp. MSJ-32 TaxID=2841527 RepID=UPI001C1289B6|nr:hypothetical protein [Caproiciproducens sp. MSJ-32]MBU5455407.1 hypothetical protein [Caproiciproducens sp. MSJ-32]